MATPITPDVIHSKETPHLITKLLMERQQVLVLFQRLVELKPYEKIRETQQLLKEFAQLLMDYIALGHFEVLPQLMEDAKARDDIKRQRLIDKFYSRIALTTETALAFNDQVEDGNGTFNAERLSQALSALGEQIAERIEWEDKLLCYDEAAV